MFGTAPELGAKRAVVILIVGGGIGGLSLAVCLARRGSLASLSSVNRRGRQSGAGSLFTPMACGRWARSTSRARSKRRAPFSTASASLPGWAAARRGARRRLGGRRPHGPGQPWITPEYPSRARRVPSPHGLGVTITAIQGGQAGARVAFSDGAERCYELVVGADGIRSAVRRLAFGQVSPRYVGQMYWRAAAPAELVESLRVVAISWGPSVWWSTAHPTVPWLIGRGVAERRASSAPQRATGSRQPMGRVSECDSLAIQ